MTRSAWWCAGMAAAAVMFLAFVLVPSLAPAAPGDLDLAFGGFGDGGQIALGAGFKVDAMVMDALGRLILVGVQNGQFHVQRRSGVRFNTVQDVPILFLEATSEATAVAIAPGGKIVVAGNVKSTANGATDFGVARLNADLSLDTTFAGGGVVVSDVGGNDDRAFGVAVQADAKIVVVGHLANGGTEGDWAIERFDENGTLDPSFDGDGKKSLGADSFANGAHAVAMQDGKILMAGTLDDDFGLVRLSSDGALDQTFGSAGVTDTGFGGAEEAFAMAFTPDGRIVVAGRSGGSLALARYSEDGVLDASFDGDGKLTTPPATEDAIAYAVAVGSDGKIFVGGIDFFFQDTGMGTVRIVADLFTIRYKSDGSIDPTFGFDGKVFELASFVTTSLLLRPDGGVLAGVSRDLFDYSWDGKLVRGGTEIITFDPHHVGSEVTALAVGGDGKLVAVGKVFVGDYGAAMARFNANVAAGLDTTFGDDSPKQGKTLFGFFGQSEELASAAVEDDGDIIAAGSLISAGGTDFLIARVTSDGVPDPTCSGDGLASNDFGGLDGSADSVASGPNGSIYAAGIAHTATTGDDYGMMRFTETCAIDNIGPTSMRNPYRFLADLGGDEGSARVIFQSSTNRPVLAGSAGGDIVLVRVRTAPLTNSLQLDSSFGNGGMAVLDTGGDDSVAALVEDSDGSLLVAGSASFTAGGETDFLVARFTSDGQLDTSFGVGGVALSTFNAVDVAHALAVRDDGTIAVAGTTTTPDGVQFALTQLTPDGALDRDFASTAGKTTLRLGPDGEDVAQAVAFVGTNRLVVGGYSTAAGIRQFALAAFQTTQEGVITTTTTTLAGPDVCGDPAAFVAQAPRGETREAVITATDALFILRVAVSLETCPLCVCDVDNSGKVAATDALLTLKVAVGQQIALTCPACD